MRQLRISTTLSILASARHLRLPGRDVCRVHSPAFNPKSKRKRRQLCLRAHSSLQGFASQALKPVPGIAGGLVVNTAVYVLGISVLLKGLTPAGVAHSWLLGTTVYAAFGWRGYLIVCLYFLLASAVRLATQEHLSHAEKAAAAAGHNCLQKYGNSLTLQATTVRLAQKEAEGIAEKRSGRRSIGSVWGSGLAGLFCSIAALTTQHHGLWKVGFLASFVSKFSDTISSEIGKAYGRTTYLSTTFKRVPRGTEGAVSLEGSLAGAAAALAFAMLAAALRLVCPWQATLVALAAVLANVFESVVGALVQGKSKWSCLSNDVMNMLQISFAAYLAMLFIDF